MINSKKLLIASAVTSVLGFASTNVSAGAISSITLGDIDGDGAVSGFRFTTTFNTNFPSGVPGTFPNDLTFGGAGDDCGAGAGSCGDLVFGPGTVGTNVFTSGFNFGGGGDFSPVINGGGTAGTVDASGLNLTALDFGGIYNGTNFLLAPEDLEDATGNAADAGQPIFAADGAFTGASSNGTAYYEDTFIDNGDGTFGFIIRWTSVISQGSSFDGQIARWRLEGTATMASAPAVPVPAAVWLFGSGLLGLVGVARRKKSA